MGKDKLRELKEKYKNKSFSTKEAKSIGVSPRMLSFYVKRGDIERIRFGVYIFPDFDVEEDFKFHELALIASNINGAVICLTSALIYWDLTEEYQGDYCLAIPNNYSIPKSTKRVKFIRPRDLKTGVMSKTIAKQKVKITTPERSVCDAFKYLDEESAITSLRSYLNQENDKIDIPLLMNTAINLKCKGLQEIMEQKAEAAGKNYPEMTSDTFKAYAIWLSKKKEK